MSATSRVATAVAAGYLLGRTKKLRLAITVGSVLAGGRLAGGGSGNLLRGLADNPQVAELGDQLRGQLLRAAKSAAINVTTTRLESLTDALREGGRAELEGSNDEEPEEEAPQDQADTDEADQDEGPEDEADQDQGPEDEADQGDDTGDQPRQRSRRSRDGGGSARRGEGTTKRAPAKKSTAKKAPAKKAPAKKTATTTKSAAGKPAAKKSSARR